MRCVADDDLSGYAREVLPWLLRDPVANNVACTVIEQRLTGALPTEPDALWLRVLDEAGRLAGVALRTPPYGLLLTTDPGASAGTAAVAEPGTAAVAEPGTAVAEAAAEATASLSGVLPGVNGPADATARFAARYAELRNVRTKPGMSQRLYRLDRVAPPSGVPGGLRPATAADRSRVLSWRRAFIKEAVPDAPHEADAAVDRRMEQGLVWLWEVDGRPVSTAWLQPPAAGVVRVGPVYTPPELRGRGYASGCVAAVSQVALDRGATACMLYTDLTNPTSNRIYQRIGYREVGDAQEWRFASQPPVGEAG